ncbi:Uncharacterised protein [Mycobacteroides abscessus subsp. abscessus]|nr:Uncharacterised protein [Mycobacteroides abscessus subsp. abscessus]
MFGPFLDEEVEWIDRFEVGNEPDCDRQLPGPVREYHAGKEITEGILLPVDEMIVGCDP